MRHTIELLVCGTIAAYCVARCWVVFPLALAEAHAIVAAYRERWLVIDAAIEEE